jgi:hypothetical protein
MVPLWPWPRVVRVLAVPAGLGWPKAWPWAWEAGLGPGSPIAMGCSEARVNSEVFLFPLYEFKSNPIQF